MLSGIISTELSVWAEYLEIHCYAGLESNRPHMLVGIIVRQKSKRPSDWQPPSKTTTSTTGSHDSPSQSKKMRMSSKDTEAYSPTAQGEDTTGHEPLYIPTPTVAIQRSNASATSSSSSTPSSSDRGSSSVSSATLPLSTSLNLPSQKSSKVLISGSGKARRRTTTRGELTWILTDFTSWQDHRRYIANLAL